MAEHNHSVAKWTKVIAAYDNEFKKWEGRTKKIIRRYKDEFRDNQRGNGQTKFNILWSNVQTLSAATFAKLPKPDVSRRFRDNDPVGRIASLILERCLDYEIQHYSDYGSTLRCCVYDRFLGGRATAWVRYEPHMQAISLQLPTDGLGASEDIDTPQEELDYECTPTDYVNWSDFGHTVARTWEEVPAVWRKVYMRRAALVERFGEELGNKIPLDSNPDTDKKDANYKEDNQTTALIYEIWDKETKQALWMSKSMDEFLDVRDDPLGLENFFPCPKPIYATISNESLVPVPDFALYQDQANELDILSDRIDGLIKALQVKGVYNAAIPELARLFTEGDNNSLIPVKDWQFFAEKNGLSGAIDLVDIKPIAEALIQAYTAMDQVKGQVYEITGISDIIRGQSEASETATAQQLKGQYASLRLKTVQDEVARFAAELLRMKAQIICTKYSPQTILTISAAEQLNPVDHDKIGPALELLKNNPLRSFRVDVSTDSLVYMDEQQEKQDRMEFLTASSNFLEKAVMAGEQAPQLVPLMMEMMKFGVTGFKVGKTIEGVFDETAEQLKQAQANPKPNPEAQAAEMEAKVEQQKLQAQQQMEQMRVQADIQIEQARAQANMQIENTKAQMQMQLDAMKHEREMEAKRMEMLLDAKFQQWKAELDAETKINVAQIGAEATLSVQQDKAAEDAANG
jgi:hypothetical protein